jgi:hypothetical protein
MQKVLKKVKAKPKHIMSDAGREFFNKEFQALMKKNNINHYHTYSDLKASIVERFNRTLKNAMWKQFSLQGNYKWLHILSRLIEKYNSTYHRTIKLPPKNVSRKNERFLLKTVYNKIKVFPKPKYKIGGFVRISKNRGIFGKSYQPNYSTEIFTIGKIKRTDPVTYNLIDYTNTPILGSFYEAELTPVKYSNLYLVEKILKRKKDRALVRWLGFNKKHDSWIKLDNIL